MKILAVEDDAVSRALLSTILQAWRHPHVVANDGETAWKLLSEDPEIRLVLLDWVLPGLNGLDLCRKIRAEKASEPPYLILLTGNDSKDEIVQGLEAGADDYVTKPFHRDELRARIGVGERILRLQEALNRRVQELESALTHVNELQGLIPICAYCKKVRDDRNYWQAVESYIGARSAARFSHGICPDCRDKVLEEQRLMTKKTGTNG